MNGHASISKDDVQRAMALLEELATEEYGHLIEELFAIEEPVTATNEFDATAMQVLNSTDAFWPGWSSHRDHDQKAVRRRQSAGHPAIAGRGTAAL